MRIQRFLLLSFLLLGCQDKSNDTDGEGGLQSLAAVDQAVLGEWSSECFDASAADGGPLASLRYLFDVVQDPDTEEMTYTMTELYFGGNFRCINPEQAQRTQTTGRLVARRGVLDLFSNEAEGVDSSILEFREEGRTELYTTYRFVNTNLHIAVSNTSGEGDSEENRILDSAGLFRFEIVFSKPLEL